MRKLRTGDKIRFLNSVGGGTVKGFINKQVVIVEDEHGFDVPVLATECVVIESAENERLQQDETVNIQEKDSTDNISISVSEIDKQSKAEETAEGEKITTCLAFLPVDEKSISSTSFEAYFVNDSNYYLFINYMNRENNSWNSRYTGIIEPNTQIFIEEFSKSSLNDIEQVCVQFVAFKHNKQYSFKNPTSVELRIDTVKFYKLHSFTDNDYFEDNALVYYITRNDIPERELLVSAGDIQRAMLEKEEQETRPRKKRIVKKEKTAITEIDLHIDQLLDTTAGMGNAEILDYQMQKFHEVMQEHIKRKGHKIVFIHGKGDGVLKSELIKNLKNKYKGCYYQDASFKEYGFGATMVTIKYRNK